MGKAMMNPVTAILRHRTVTPPQSIGILYAFRLPNAVVVRFILMMF